VGSVPLAPTRAARGWRRRPLLAASVALHVVAAALVAWQTSTWPWALGLVIANHLLLTAVGLWPRSRWLGPNATRLASSTAVAVTIDDGPDPEVTPRVLQILARAGARATFFCVGERIAAHADIGRQIVGAGHRIENHSQRHSHLFSLFGPRGMRADVEAAQLSIAAVTGRSPRFFRAPAGLRNPFLDAQLEKLGLELVSWTRRGFDTVTHDPEVVLERLTRNLAGGDIVLLHDGHAARTASGQPVIVEVLPRLLEAIKRAGLTAVALDEALP
jgi:peptidoglycan/xylan/chitin deacetylase (PgdA/CDA1 family)